MRTIQRALVLLALGAGPTALAGASCSSSPAVADLGPSTFAVTITSINGNNKLPTEANPLPANKGDVPESWAFTIEARSPTGDKVTDFNGYVRLSMVPGTIISVSGPGAQGRNILVTNGSVSGTVQATAVYGPTRLWVEDLGYVPAAAGTTPQCANGEDDNGNGLIDYPADPGCYYADDDSEDPGTYTAGVSPAMQYSLPTVADVRGGARTPFPNEAIEIATAAPHNVVVTRVSNSGFFVTDTSITGGYNSLYAYNFSAPPNLRICDKLTYLGGTANDFYGFTQLSFPSFQNQYDILGLDGGPVDTDAGVPGCTVPEPQVLDPSFFAGDKNTTAKNLYKFEAGLVRIEGFTIAKNFGGALATNNTFGPGQSNCDFNGDGVIDFTQIAPACKANCEGDCATLCDGDPNCSEWTSYSERSEFKMTHGTCSGPAGCSALTSESTCKAMSGCSWSLSAATMIKVNASTVGSFDPVNSAGATIPYVTGSLTEFSGGTLNWTIEVRCPDDLVCDKPLGCTQNDKPVPVAAACVRPRTLADNDEGTN